MEGASCQNPPIRYQCFFQISCEGGWEETQATSPPLQCSAKGSHWKPTHWNTQKVHPAGGVPGDQASCPRSARSNGGHDPKTRKAGETHTWNQPSAEDIIPWRQVQEKGRNKLPALQRYRGVPSGSQHGRKEGSRTGLISCRDIPTTPWCATASKGIIQPHSQNRTHPAPHAETPHCTA